jgi:hypothetical protein
MLLARKADMMDKFTPKQARFLEELSDLYAASRYPDGAGVTLPSNKQQTQHILSGTGDLLAWIKKQLSR